VSGPDPALIENSTGRRLRRVTVTDSSLPGRRLSKNQLEIYRPNVVASSEGQRPAPSRITDVKDIRPMRERNRDYQPATSEGNEAVGSPGGQGGRESTGRDVNSRQVQNRRERDTRREYEMKQEEMKRNQEERELQQQQRSVDQERRSQGVERPYKQKRADRIQRSDQQKKIMQKERERDAREVNDTSRNIQTRSVRQNRR
jgi:hypothetical protein